jgi:bifunctional DNA-binding transcriptional regulator/antitoxin component of YhaV-PrlF toxin-antitoxin module
MNRRVRITRGGQISIPAAVRRRWATDNVLLVDEGDAVILRPLPADPLKAAINSLKLPEGLSSDVLRARGRAEEESVANRKRARR